RRLHGNFEPKEIFDTNIAAQLLGYEGQGLADLAKRHCGLALSKKSQKADWSQRPLTEEMLVYAANDTHHLKTISDIMEVELRELGRWEWQKQNCNKTLKSAFIPREAKSDERAWQIKGSK